MLIRDSRRNLHKMILTDVLYRVAFTNLFENHAKNYMFEPFFGAPGSQNGLKIIRKNYVFV